MGYNIYRFGEREGADSGAMEFKRAAKMAKEAIERMCELGEEMEDRYGEREPYHERHGMREDYDDMYGERRGRDAMGRYTRR